MSATALSHAVGERIGEHLTVLATVDAKKGRHPILMVWNHSTWSPMACKVFDSAEDAAAEASILAALAHPNIVRPFGGTEQGVLLLEFLEGPTLARVIDSAAGRRLGLSDALRLAIHVGSALHHMHRQGLIHLDLSPSNIIVTSGRPVLIDFGTARRLSEPRPGDVVGTDAYIAPEECRLEALTPAADVFGLAVLLYELLCGRRPFPRGSRRQPFPQVEGRPSPLSRYRNGLPNELERLLRACLAPDPLARPALPDLLVALNGMIRGGRRMWPAGFDPTVGSAATRVSKRGASQPPFPGLACEFDSSREFPA